MSLNLTGSGQADESQQKHDGDGTKQRETAGGKGGQGTNLLENKRLEPAMSCDGEPAPDRELLAILPEAFRLPLDMPKGDLEDGRGISAGELFAEGDVERV